MAFTQSVVMQKDPAKSIAMSTSDDITYRPSFEFVAKSQSRAARPPYRPLERTVLYMTIP